MKTRRIFIAIFMLAAILAASAHAETINVIDLGEGSYTSAGDKLINITGSKGEPILKALSVIPADCNLPESHAIYGQDRSIIMDCRDTSRDIADNHHIRRQSRFLRSNKLSGL